MKRGRYTGGGISVFGEQSVGNKCAAKARTTFRGCSLVGAVIYNNYNRIPIQLVQVQPLPLALQT